jgi:hypothetical protein
MGRPSLLRLRQQAWCHRSTCQSRIAMTNAFIAANAPSRHGQRVHSDVATVDVMAGITLLIQRAKGVRLPPRVHRTRRRPAERI